MGDVAEAVEQRRGNCGAGVGGISGGVNGHPVEGLGVGAAAGGVGALARPFRSLRMATTSIFRRGRRLRWWVAAAAVGAGGAGKSKRAGC